MTNHQDGLTPEEKLLVDFKRERREISQLFLKADITYYEYSERVHKLISDYLDKLNQLPKVSDMII